MPATVRSAVFANTAAALEGQQKLHEAQTFWIRSVQAVGRKRDPIIELGALVGSIRIRRKLGRGRRLRDKEIGRSIDILQQSFSDVVQHRVLAREAAAELSEFLLSSIRLSSEEIVRKLVLFVLDANEAFPTAVQDERRLREIADEFREVGKISSIIELNDTLGKLVYSKSRIVLAQLIYILRDEVDRTLKNAPDYR
jgi:hypothetical protein